MPEIEFEVNDKIELEIPAGLYRGSYPSKIQGVNENSLEVMPPYKNGELLPVREGTEVRGFFTRDDAAYKFYSRVKDRIIKQIPLLVLSYPQEVARIQRRDFFRLEVRRKVKYRRVNYQEEVEEDLKSGHTQDISAGGIKLLAKEKYGSGTVLELYIDIKPIKDIPLRAEVVQSYDILDSDKYALGLEFIDISSVHRDSIISWMFDYQRELRQKGLL